jgi:hypothetical protein
MNLTTKRLLSILSAMPLGMGAGLFRKQDLRALAPMLEPRSDLHSLRGDWIKIGRDFRVAAQKLEADITRSD